MEKIKISIRLEMDIMKTIADACSYYNIAANKGKTEKITSISRNAARIVVELIEDKNYYEKTKRT